jgi:hypothetical protein
VCSVAYVTPHCFPRLCVAYPMIKKLTVKCLHPVAVSVLLFVVNTCLKLESLCITIPAQIPELSSAIYWRRITKLITKGKPKVRRRELVVRINVMQYKYFTHLELITKGVEGGLPFCWHRTTHARGPAQLNSAE